MRIIFSRKGFDSSAGGCPSPLIRGRPTTLPIPSQEATPSRYADLRSPLPELVQQLSRGRIKNSSFCHLDPDLERKRMPRRRGWRASLGQAGAAQGHLLNQGVGPGDLFLFWGLFQQAVRTPTQSPNWRFRGPRQHGLFGWLQVEEVVQVSDAPAVKKEYPWLAQHPHLMGDWPNNNCIYLARRTLCMPGISKDIPGWGTLRRLYPLTQEGGELVSQWRVPDWLNPAVGNTPDEAGLDQAGVGMTYHPPNRWHKDGTLRSAARGQEFVAQLANSSAQHLAACEWLQQLLQQYR